MKKILKLTALLLVLIMLSLFLFNESEYEYDRRSFFAMDTLIDISIEAKDVQEKLDSLEALITEMDSELSRSDEESLIYRLNHSSRAWAQLGDEAVELIKEAEELNYFTGKLFDISVAPLMDLWGFGSDEPRVPGDEEIANTLNFVGMEHVHLNENIVSLDPGSGLDFGGIAKGAALEKAENFFREQHIKRGIVYMGGDIMVYGSKPKGELWSVALQDPSSPDNSLSYAGLLNIKNSYIMTSGNYQRFFTEDGVRYHHILDPRSGRPAESGLSSVTVTADIKEGSGAMWDGLSTALFIMGRDEALEFWRINEGLFEFVIITDDNEVLVSEGLKDSFVPDESGKFEYSIVYRD